MHDAAPVLVHISGGSLTLSYCFFSLQFQRGLDYNCQHPLIATTMASQSSELSVPYATADEVYAAAIVLPVLGIVFLALRWQQRRHQREGIGIDDWLMIPSLVCAFVTLHLCAC